MGGGWGGEWEKIMREVVGNGGERGQEGEGGGMKEKMTKTRWRARGT